MNGDTPLTQPSDAYPDPLETDTPASAEDETVHHISTREKRKQKIIGGGNCMQINLTSMIDVIFQLLIYFVVTSSMAIGEGIITAKLPTGPGDPADRTTPPERPLKIIVKSAGAIGIEYRISIEGFAERPNSFIELSDLLKQRQYDLSRGLTGQFKPDNPVFIMPGYNVRWQHVVNAFNAAVRARYTNVSFAQAKSTPE